MPAKRQSATQKLLKLIDGLVDETSVYLDYGKLRRRLHGRWDYKTNLSKAIDNLKTRGYLEIVEIDGSKTLKMSIKGRLKIMKNPRKKPWDGRWRLIGFDIEEIRKGVRNRFRFCIKQLGFKQMQKSLWIFPYDVSEDIEELIDVFKLENSVDYFVAEAITNKQKYINMFDLNQEK